VFGDGLDVKTGVIGGVLVGFKDKDGFEVEDLFDVVAAAGNSAIALAFSLGAESVAVFECGEHPGVDVEGGRDRIFSRRVVVFSFIAVVDQEDLRFVSGEAEFEFERSEECGGRGRAVERMVSFEGVDAEFFAKFFAHSHDDLPAKFLSRDGSKGFFNFLDLACWGERAVCGAVSFADVLGDFVDVKLIDAIVGECGEGHDVSSGVFSAVPLERCEAQFLFAADVVASCLNVAATWVLSF
jgi:hypothetical protein